MSVKVKLVQGLVNPVQTWEPGQLFDCANQQDAQELIAAGIAVPLESEQPEEKPKAKSKKG
jgi:hypothetical protein